MQQVGDTEASCGSIQLILSGTGEHQQAINAVGKLANKSPY